MVGKNPRAQNNEAMVVSAEQASEDSFRRVQSLRHVNDVAMFAQACCNSNLGIIRGLSAVRVAAPGRPMGESEALSSILVALQGYVDSTLVLQNRIRNTIDLVGQYASSPHRSEVCLVVEW